jgi:hypothetical protein
MMQIAKAYEGLTDWVVVATGQSETVLHIHAGMAVFVLARLTTGRSFGTFIPFCFVLAAELGNELLDFLLLGRWQQAETTIDLTNTLFWPLAISLGVRVRPMILRDRRKIGAAMTPAGAAVGGDL